MQYFYIRQNYIGSNYDALIFFDGNNNMVSFPTDPANSDYQQYLAWVAEGNTAEEWDNS